MCRYICISARKQLAHLGIFRGGGYRGVGVTAAQPRQRRAAVGIDGRASVAALAQQRYGMYERQILAYIVGAAGQGAHMEYLLARGH